MTLSRLQGDSYASLSNVIFRTAGQQWTRFQLTLHGPSAVVEFLISVY